jgi:hypothetical protein
MQKAFAAGDVARVRALFQNVETTTKMQRPADISLDRVFQEAWLRLAIGDTTVAVRQLDQTLRSLSSRSASSFRDPAAAAALPRVFLLRAQLARAVGDANNTERWTRALAELWAKAHPDLRAAANNATRAGSAAH